MRIDVEIPTSSGTVTVELEEDILRSFMRANVPSHMQDALESRLEEYILRPIVEKFARLVSSSLLLGVSSVEALQVLDIELMGVAKRNVGRIHTLLDAEDSLGKGHNEN